MTNEQFLPTRIITMSRYRTQDEQRAELSPRSTTSKHPPRTLHESVGAP